MALTFGNCLLKNGVIEWPLKLYEYTIFTSEKHDFFRFFELLHTFSPRTLLAGALNAA